MIGINQKKRKHKKSKKQNVGQSPPFANKVSASSSKYNKPKLGRLPLSERSAGSIWSSPSSKTEVLKETDSKFTFEFPVALSPKNSGVEPCATTKKSVQNSIAKGSGCKSCCKTNNSTCSNISRTIKKSNRIHFAKLREANMSDSSSDENTEKKEKRSNLRLKNFDRVHSEKNVFVLTPVRQISNSLQNNDSKELAFIKRPKRKFRRARRNKPTEQATPLNAKLTSDFHDNRYDLTCASRSEQSNLDATNVMKFAATPIATLSPQCPETPGKHAPYKMLVNPNRNNIFENNSQLSTYKQVFDENQSSFWERYHPTYNQIDIPETPGKSLPCFAEYITKHENTNENLIREKNEVLNNYNVYESLSPVTVLDKKSQHLISAVALNSLPSAMHTESTDEINLELFPTKNSQNFNNYTETEDLSYRINEEFQASDCLHDFFHASLRTPENDNDFDFAALPSTPGKDIPGLKHIFKKCSKSHPSNLEGHVSLSSSSSTSSLTSTSSATSSSICIGLEDECCRKDRECLAKTTKYNKVVEDVCHGSLNVPCYCLYSPIPSTPSCVIHLNNISQEMIDVRQLYPNSNGLPSTASNKNTLPLNKSSYYPIPLALSRPVLVSGGESYRDTSFNASLLHDAKSPSPKENFCSASSSSYFCTASTQYLLSKGIIADEQSVLTAHDKFMNAIEGNQQEIYKVSRLCSLPTVNHTNMVKSVINYGEAFPSMFNICHGNIDQKNDDSSSCRLTQNEFDLSVSSCISGTDEENNALNATHQNNHNSFVDQPNLLTKPITPLPAHIPLKENKFDNNSEDNKPILTGHKVSNCCSTTMWANYHNFAYEEINMSNVLQTKQISSFNDCHMTNHVRYIPDGEGYREVPVTPGRKPDQMRAEHALFGYRSRSHNNKIQFGSFELGSSDESITNVDAQAEPISEVLFDNTFEQCSTSSFASFPNSYVENGLHQMKVPDTYLLDKFLISVTNYISKKEKVENNDNYGQLTESNDNITDSERRLYVESNIDLSLLPTNEPEMTYNYSKSKCSSTEFEGFLCNKAMENSADTSIAAIKLPVATKRDFKAISQSAINTHKTTDTFQLSGALSEDAEFEMTKSKRNPVTICSREIHNTQMKLCDETNASPFSQPSMSSISDAEEFESNRSCALGRNRSDLKKVVQCSTNKRNKCCDFESRKNVNYPTQSLAEPSAAGYSGDCSLSFDAQILPYESAAEVAHRQYSTEMQQSPISTNKSPLNLCGNTISSKNETLSSQSQSTVVRSQIDGVYYQNSIHVRQEDLDENKFVSKIIDVNPCSDINATNLPHYSYKNYSESDSLRIENKNKSASVLDASRNLFADENSSNELICVPRYSNEESCGITPANWKPVGNVVSNKLSDEVKSLVKSSSPENNAQWSYDNKCTSQNHLFCSVHSVDLSMQDNTSEYSPFQNISSEEHLEENDFEESVSGYQSCKTADFKYTVKFIPDATHTQKYELEEIHSSTYDCTSKCMSDEVTGDVTPSAQVSATDISIDQYTSPAQNVKDSSTAQYYGENTSLHYDFNEDSLTTRECIEETPLKEKSVKDDALFPNLVKDDPPVPYSIKNESSVSGCVKDESPVPDFVKDNLPDPDSVKDDSSVPNSALDDTASPDSVKDSPAANSFKDDLPVPDSVKDDSPVSNSVIDDSPAPNSVKDISLDMGFVRDDSPDMDSVNDDSHTSDSIEDDSRALNSVKNHSPAPYSDKNCLQAPHSDEIDLQFPYSHESVLPTSGLIENESQHQNPLQDVSTFNYFDTVALPTQVSTALLDKLTSPSHHTKSEAPQVISEHIAAAEIPLSPSLKTSATSTLTKTNEQPHIQTSIVTLLSSSLATSKLLSNQSANLELANFICDEKSSFIQINNAKTDFYPHTTSEPCFYPTVNEELHTSPALISMSPSPKNIGAEEQPSPVDSEQLTFSPSSIIKLPTPQIGLQKLPPFPIVITELRTSTPFISEPLFSSSVTLEQCPSGSEATVLPLTQTTSQTLPAVLQPAETITTELSSKTIATDLPDGEILATNMSLCKTSAEFPILKTDFHKLSPTRTLPADRSHPLTAKDEPSGVRKRSALQTSVREISTEFLPSLNTLANLSADVESSATLEIEQDLASDLIPVHNAVLEFATSKASIPNLPHVQDLTDLTFTHNFSLDLTPAQNFEAKLPPPDKLVQEMSFLEYSETKLRFSKNLELHFSDTNQFGSYILPSKKIASELPPAENFAEELLPIKSFGEELVSHYNLVAKLSSIQESKQTANCELAQRSASDRLDQRFFFNSQIGQDFLITSSRIDCLLELSTGSSPESERKKNDFLESYPEKIKDTTRCNDQNEISTFVPDVPTETHVQYVDSDISSKKTSNANIIIDSKETEIDMMTEKKQASTKCTDNPAITAQFPETFENTSSESLMQSSTVTHTKLKAGSMIVPKTLYTTPNGSDALKGNCPLDTSQRVVLNQVITVEKCGQPQQQKIHKGTCDNGLQNIFTHNNETELNESKKCESASSIVSDLNISDDQSAIVALKFARNGVKEFNSANSLTASDTEKKIFNEEIGKTDIHTIISCTETSSVPEGYNVKNYFSLSAHGENNTHTAKNQSLNIIEPKILKKSITELSNSEYSKHECQFSPKYELYSEKQLESKLPYGQQHSLGLNEGKLIHFSSAKNYAGLHENHFNNIVQSTVNADLTECTISSDHYSIKDYCQKKFVERHLPVDDTLNKLGTFLESSPPSENFNFKESVVICPDKDEHLDTWHVKGPTLPADVLDMPKLIEFPQIRQNLNDSCQSIQLPDLSASSDSLLLTDENMKKEGTSFEPNENILSTLRESFPSKSGDSTYMAKASSLKVNSETNVKTATESHKKSNALRKTSTLNVCGSTNKCRKSQANENKVKYSVFDKEGSVKYTIKYPLQFLSGDLFKPKTVSSAESKSVFTENPELKETISPNELIKNQNQLKVQPNDVQVTNKEESIDEFLKEMFGEDEPEMETCQMTVRNECLLINCKNNCTQTSISKQNCSNTAEPSVTPNTSSNVSVQRMNPTTNAVQPSSEINLTKTYNLMYQNENKLLVPNPQTITLISPHLAAQVENLPVNRENVNNDKSTPVCETFSSSENANSCNTNRYKAQADDSSGTNIHYSGANSSKESGCRALPLGLSESALPRNKSTVVPDPPLSYSLRRNTSELLAAVKWQRMKMKLEEACPSFRETPSGPTRVCSSCRAGPLSHPVSHVQVGCCRVRADRERGKYPTLRTLLEERQFVYEFELDRHCRGRYTSRGETASLFSPPAPSEKSAPQTVGVTLLVRIELPFQYLRLFTINNLMVEIVLDRCPHVLAWQRFGSYKRALLIMVSEKAPLQHLLINTPKLSAGQQQFLQQLVHQLPRSPVHKILLSNSAQKKELSHTLSCGWPWFQQSLQRRPLVRAPLDPLPVWPLSQQPSGNSAPQTNLKNKSSPTRCKKNLHENENLHWSTQTCLTKNPIHDRKCNITETSLFNKSLPLTGKEHITKYPSTNSLTFSTEEKSHLQSTPNATDESIPQCIFPPNDETNDRLLDMEIETLIEHWAKKVSESSSDLNSTSLSLQPTSFAVDTLSARKHTFTVSAQVPSDILEQGVPSLSFQENSAYDTFPKSIHKHNSNHTKNDSLFNYQDDIKFDTISKGKCNSNIANGETHCSVGNDIATQSSLSSAVTNADVNSLRQSRTQAVQKGCSLNSSIFAIKKTAKDIPEITSEFQRPNIDSLPQSEHDCSTQLLPQAKLRPLPPAVSQPGFVERTATMSYCSASCNPRLKLHSTNHFESKVNNKPYTAMTLQTRDSLQLKNSTARVLHIGSQTDEQQPVPSSHQYIPRTLMSNKQNTIYYEETPECSERLFKLNNRYSGKPSPITDRHFKATLKSPYPSNQSSPELINYREVPANDHSVLKTRNDVSFSSLPVKKFQPTTVTTKKQLIAYEKIPCAKNIRTDSSIEHDQLLINLLTTKITENNSLFDYKCVITRRQAQSLQRRNTRPIQVNFNNPVTASNQGSCYYKNHNDYFPRGCLSKKVITFNEHKKNRMNSSTSIDSLTVEGSDSHKITNNPKKRFATLAAKRSLQDETRIRKLQLMSVKKNVATLRQKLSCRKQITGSKRLPTSYITHRNEVVKTIYNKITPRVNSVGKVKIAAELKRLLLKQKRLQEMEIAVQKRILYLQKHEQEKRTFIEKEQRAACFKRELKEEHQSKATVRYEHTRTPAQSLFYTLKGNYQDEPNNVIKNKSKRNKKKFNVKKNEPENSNNTRLYRKETASRMSEGDSLSVTDDSSDSGSSPVTTHKPAEKEINVNNHESEKHNCYFKSKLPRNGRNEGNRNIHVKAEDVHRKRLVKRSSNISEKLDEKCIPKKLNEKDIKRNTATREIVLSDELITLDYELKKNSFDEDLETVSKNSKGSRKRLLETSERLNNLEKNKRKKYKNSCNIGTKSNSMNLRESKTRDEQYGKDYSDELNLKEKNEIKLNVSQCGRIHEENIIENCNSAGKYSITNNNKVQNEMVKNIQLRNRKNNCTFEVNNNDEDSIICNEDCAAVDHRRTINEIQTKKLMQDSGNLNINKRSSTVISFVNQSTVNNLYSEDNRNPRRTSMTENSSKLKAMEDSLPVQPRKAECTSVGHKLHTYNDDEETICSFNLQPLVTERALSPNLDCATVSSLKTDSLPLKSHSSVSVPLMKYKVINAKTYHEHKRSGAIPRTNLSGTTIRIKSISVLEEPSERNTPLFAAEEKNGSIELMSEDFLGEETSPSGCAVFKDSAHITIENPEFIDQSRFIF